MLIDLNIVRDHKQLSATIAHVKIQSNLTPNKWLSNDENRYFETLKSKKRQDQYLAGRIALKKSLGRQLNIPSQEIVITTGAFGFPLIDPKQTKIADCSLTHSNTDAVAIASPYGHPVTIDVEQIRSKTTGITSKLTPHEIGLLKTLKAHQTQALTALWTIKEALSKAVRCGLYADWSILEIKTVRQTEDYAYEATFSNWFQYKSMVLIFDTACLSLVIPKNSNLTSCEPIYFRFKPIWGESDAN